MPKPGLPQGMRDFTAATVHKRNFILGTIRTVFELYGFEPLETPAMENLETLTGKYGEEGDKLIFKVLNNGLSDPKNSEKASAGFEQLLAGKNTASLTERALKYDLTIPFARFLAMNAGTLTLPYKRYQIQQVWRADRPQKGRYREFTQCDADVAGTTSLLNEVDFCNIYHDCFTRLGLHDYRLRINSRKLLSALADVAGGAEKMMSITIAIDKMDKIGLEKVNIELAAAGLTAENISAVNNYLSITGSNAEKIASIEKLFGDNINAQAGIDELKFVIGDAAAINLEIDLTLARGLNYYTGIIFEAAAPEGVQMGSIGGGGRYDDLTGLFGLKGISGAGISFGIDRIYDVMEELNIFPADAAAGTKVLALNLGTEELITLKPIVAALRSLNISCEVYPEAAKMEKQLKYADKKNIRFALIIGAKEIAETRATVKNLKNGSQNTLALAEISSFFENEFSSVTKTK